MTNEGYLTTAESLPEAWLQAYRKQGYVRVPGVISEQEVKEFREAALEASQRALAKEPTSAYEQVFAQTVNVWREHEVMRRLTLHPNIAAIAEKLAGVPLRLWHDHVLIKRPQKSTATEFHQDQPYWPHANSPSALSAWIALSDVPVERGCMTFIPGSHTKTELQAQDLTDAGSLLKMCPEFIWKERVTIPLKAGDCTFHHARTAHMANPNTTDELRIAHAVIFMDATTTYTGAPHVVTDPLALSVGAALEGEWFPLCADLKQHG